MATENVKDYLFEQTGIAQSQWKRISKSKNQDGSENRIFQDKSSGRTIQTVEAKDGIISIVENNNEVEKNNKPIIDSKAVIKLIKKVLEQEKELTGKELGYNEIPKYFNFCFLEDANPDHSEAMKDAANSLDPKIAVTSFNIFFTPKFKNESSCMHLSQVLQSFLPDFLRETEEQSFAVHPKTMSIYDEDRLNGLKNGNIPYIPYDALVATLEKAGFTYDIKDCMLGKLGGSQGAEALEAEVPPKENLKFCLVAVKDQSYHPNSDRSKNKDCDHITAVLVDVDKNRDNKEKLINKALKKYQCTYSGRIMNGMLPHIELVQLIKKKAILKATNNEDRQAIYDELIALGWQYDSSLANLENAKKWTLEKWAVTPMEKSPFITLHSQPLISDSASDIQYYIWEPPKPKLKF